MRFQLLILFFPLMIIGQNSNVDLVDPFIGTGGHGHTFPGATMPFGMVQLSPQTNFEEDASCPLPPTRQYSLKFRFSVDKDERFLF